MLQDLMDGHPRKCGICCGTVVHPTFTRCVHMFCAECVTQWFTASKALVDQQEQNRRNGKCPCPICRQLFTLDSLILVKIAPPEVEHQG